MLDKSYAFPLDGRPHAYCPNPDAMMIASIVVATKHLFPFEDHDQPNPFTQWRFDWAKWLQLIPTMSDKNNTLITTDDVYKLSEEDLDTYVSNQNSSAGGGDSGLPEDLLSLFPLSDQQPSPPTPAEGNTGVDMDEIMVQFHRTMTVSDETADLHKNHLYTRYREPWQQNGAAKVFHERACKLSGLKMETLLKVVIAMERKMESWARSQKAKRK